LTTYNVQEEKMEFVVFSQTLSRGSVADERYWCWAEKRLLSQQLIFVGNWGLAVR
jgi:hypothetical protein